MNRENRFKNLVYFKVIHFFIFTGLRYNKFVLGENKGFYISIEMRKGVMKVSSESSVTEIGTVKLVYAL